VAIKRKRGRRPRFIGIYEIKCLNTNKIYIGSSKDMTMRWNSHIWDTIQDKHVCKVLQQEVKARGISSLSFRILEILSFDTTPKELRTREQYYMNMYSKEQLLNSKRAIKLGV
jgi:group I intron endonuclease